MKAIGYIDENIDNQAKKQKESTILEVVNQLAKDYGFDQIGFFDIKEWKNLSDEDIDEIKRHFEWIKQRAKIRSHENEF